MSDLRDAYNAISAVWKKGAPKVSAWMDLATTEIDSLDTRAVVTAARIGGLEARVARLENPAPPEPVYIWHDEFDGPAGSPPDPAKWWATPWCSTSPNELYHCYTPGNAYLDGHGNLVLKVSPGTRGRPFNSARIQTFQEGTWPPSKVLAQFAAPCRIEARVKFAPGAGLWGAVWANSNSAQSDNFELDAQEFRGKYSSDVAAHTHHWVNGVDQAWAAVIATGVDLSAGFHRYWTEYYSDSVDFGFDDTLVGRNVIACKYPIMPRLSHEVGVPGTWGGDGGPPPQSSIPALMLVDYVRVTAL